MLKFFKYPFGISGTRTAVPDLTQIDGTVSYQEGYNLNYQRTQSDPQRKNIERDKFNQILFDASNAISEIQQLGFPDFITTALNGGVAFAYDINAMCRYNGQIYISRKTNNTSLPTVAADWALARINIPSATATGTVNAVAVDFVPDVGTLVDGDILKIQHTGANTTAVTIAPDGTTPLATYKGANAPLVAGDIAGANFWGLYVYDASANALMMVNPATGVATAAPPTLASVAASAAANALTATVNPQDFYFRNPTLTNGVPVKRTLLSAASVVAANGVLLGGIAGVPNLLYVLAIDATGVGGGVEAALVSESSAALLNEQGIINTDAITAAAVMTASIASTGVMTVTAVISGAFLVGMQLVGAGIPAGTRIVSFGTGTGGTGTYNTDCLAVVASTTITGSPGYGIYSTTARTGVPYRIAGIVLSTQAAAGVWATQPSLVVPVGGNALMAMGTLGFRQSWKSFTVGTNRFNGANHVNLSGSAIAVGIWTSQGVATVISNSITVGGVTVCQQQIGASGNGSSGIGWSFAIVPAGATYNVAGASGWSEMRL